MNQQALAFGVAVAAALIVGVVIVALVASLIPLDALHDVV